MNVCSVCVVAVATLAARKLIDVLQMIRTGFPGISHDHLTVLVPESDCGRVCAFWRTLSGCTREKILSRSAMEQSAPARQLERRVTLERRFRRSQIAHLP